MQMGTWKLCQVVQVSWNERSVTLADGEVLQLRTPLIRITGLAFGPLGEDIMISPRMAPR
jgi:CxxC motif-containing protein (DUF1111 family)